MDKMESFISKAAWVVAASLFGIGAWVGVIQTQVKNNSDDILDHREEIHSLLEGQNEDAVITAEIRTRLTSIEVTQRDTKNTLKEIQTLLTGKK
jgi:hypothetical protein